MKRTLFLLFFSVSLFKWGFAQDPHFSQFYAHSLYLNPALAGIMEGQYRGSAIYREQWTSVLQNTPFRTYGFAADARWNTVSDDYFTIGFNALRDEVGTANFNQTKGYLSLAYLKQLSGGRYASSEHFISLGVQGGFAQNQINWSALSFGEQFDPNSEQYDPDLPNGESLDQNKVNYLDFNVGLLWYAVFNEKTSVYAGAALNHLNRPNISFQDSDDKLYARWLGNIGAEIVFSNRASLLPAVVFMKQGAALEANFGTSVRVSGGYQSDLAVRLGLWSRIVTNETNSLDNDAIIGTFMLEKKQWLIGISYDINTSSLATASNSRGAYELSLTYIHPEKRRVRVSCPRL